MDDDGDPFASAVCSGLAADSMAATTNTSSDEEIVVDDDPTEDDVQMDFLGRPPTESALMEMQPVVAGRTGTRSPPIGHLLRMRASSNGSTGAQERLRPRRNRKDADDGERRDSDSDMDGANDHASVSDHTEGDADGYSMSGESVAESILCEGCDAMNENAAKAHSAVAHLSHQVKDHSQQKKENLQLRGLYSDSTRYIEQLVIDKQRLEASNCQLLADKESEKARVEEMERQISVLIAKANESQVHLNAANDWRAKYDLSQETLKKTNECRQALEKKFEESLKVAKSWREKFQKTDEKVDVATQKLRVLVKHVPFFLSIVDGVGELNSAPANLRKKCERFADAGLRAELLGKKMPGKSTEGDESDDETDELANQLERELSTPSSSKTSNKSKPTPVASSSSSMHNDLALSDSEEEGETLTFKEKKIRKGAAPSAARLPVPVTPTTSVLKADARKSITDSAARRSVRFRSPDHLEESFTIPARGATSESDVSRATSPTKSTEVYVHPTKTVTSTRGKMAVRTIGAAPAPSTSSWIAPPTTTKKGGKGKTAARHPEAEPPEMLPSTLRAMKTVERALARRATMPEAIRPSEYREGHVDEGGVRSIHGTKTMTVREQQSKMNIQESIAALKREQTEKGVKGAQEQNTKGMTAGASRSPIKRVDTVAEEVHVDPKKNEEKELVGVSSELIPEQNTVTQQHVESINLDFDSAIFGNDQPMVGDGGALSDLDPFEGSVLDTVVDEHYDMDNNEDPFGEDPFEAMPSTSTPYNTVPFGQESLDSSQLPESFLESYPMDDVSMSLPSYHSEEVTVEERKTVEPEQTEEPSTSSQIASEIAVMPIVVSPVKKVDSPPKKRVRSPKKSSVLVNDLQMSESSDSDSDEDLIKKQVEKAKKVETEKKVEVDSVKPVQSSDPVLPPIHASIPSVTPPTLSTSTLRSFLGQPSAVDDYDDFDEETVPVEEASHASTSQVNKDQEEVVIDEKKYAVADVVKEATVDSEAPLLEEPSRESEKNEVLEEAQVYGEPNEVVAEQEVTDADSTAEKVPEVEDTSTVIAASEVPVISDEVAEAETVPIEDATAETSPEAEEASTAVPEVPLILEAATEAETAEKVPEADQAAVIEPVILETPVDLVEEEAEPVSQPDEEPMEEVPYFWSETVKMDQDTPSGHETVVVREEEMQVEHGAGETGEEEGETEREPDQKKGRKTVRRTSVERTTVKNVNKEHVVKASGTVPGPPKKEREILPPSSMEQSTVPVKKDTVPPTVSPVTKSTISTSTVTTKRTPKPRQQSSKTEEEPEPFKIPSSPMRGFARQSSQSSTSSLEGSPARPVRSTSGTTRSPARVGGLRRDHPSSTVSVSQSSDDENTFSNISILSKDLELSDSDSVASSSASESGAAPERRRQQRRMSPRASRSGVKASPPTTSTVPTRAPSTRRISREQAMASESVRPDEVPQRAEKKDPRALNTTKSFLKSSQKEATVEANASDVVEIDKVATPVEMAPETETVEPMPETAAEEEEEETLFSLISDAKKSDVAAEKKIAVVEKAKDTVDEVPVTKKPSTVSVSPLTQRTKGTVATVTRTPAMVAQPTPRLSQVLPEDMKSTVDLPTRVSARTRVTTTGAKSVAGSVEEKKVREPSPIKGLVTTRRGATTATLNPKILQNVVVSGSGQNDEDSVDSEDHLVIEETVDPASSSISGEMVIPKAEPGQSLNDVETMSVMTFDSRSTFDNGDIPVRKIVIDTSDSDGEQMSDGGEVEVKGEDEEAVDDHEEEESVAGSCIIVEEEEERVQDYGEAQTGRRRVATVQQRRESVVKGENAEKTQTKGAGDVVKAVPTPISKPSVVRKPSAAPKPSTSTTPATRPATKPKSGLLALRDKMGSGRGRDLVTMGKMMSQASKKVNERATAAAVVKPHPISTMKRVVAPRITVASTSKEKAAVTRGASVDAYADEDDELHIVDTVDEGDEEEKSTISQETKETPCEKKGDDNPDDFAWKDTKRIARVSKQGVPPVSMSALAARRPVLLKATPPTGPPRVAQRMRASTTTPSTSTTSTLGRSGDTAARRAAHGSQVSEMQPVLDPLLPGAKGRGTKRAAVMIDLNSAHGPPTKRRTGVKSHSTGPAAILESFLADVSRGTSLEVAVRNVGTTPDEIPKELGVVESARIVAQHINSMNIGDLWTGLHRALNAPGGYSDMAVRAVCKATVETDVIELIHQMDAENLFVHVFRQLSAYIVRQQACTVAQLCRNVRVCCFCLWFCEELDLPQKQKFTKQLFSFIIRERSGESVLPSLCYGMFSDCLPMFHWLKEAEAEVERSALRLHMSGRSDKKAAADMALSLLDIHLDPITANEIEEMWNEGVRSAERESTREGAVTESGGVITFSDGVLATVPWLCNVISFKYNVADLRRVELWEKLLDKTFRVLENWSGSAATTEDDLFADRSSDVHVVSVENASRVALRLRLLETVMHDVTMYGHHADRATFSWFLRRAIEQTHKFKPLLELRMRTHATDARAMRLVLAGMNDWLTGCQTYSTLNVIKASS